VEGGGGSEFLPACLVTRAVNEHGNGMGVKRGSGG